MEGWGLLFAIRKHLMGSEGGLNGQIGLNFIGGGPCQYQQEGKNTKTPNQIRVTLLCHGVPEILTLHAPWSWAQCKSAGLGNGSVWKLEIFWVIFLVPYIPQTLPKISDARSIWEFCSSVQSIWDFCSGVQNQTRQDAPRFVKNSSRRSEIYETIPKHLKEIKQYIKNVNQ